VETDDAHDAQDEPNGVSATLTFESTLDSTNSDDAEDETAECESGEPAPELAPQNRPIAGANSVVVAPARKPETAQVRRKPVPAAAPSEKGVAAEDLDRLKHALAELEACRRMLDKANEGGR